MKQRWSLLALTHLLSGCSTPRLPLPTPNEHARAPLDTACRSPVEARRWHYRYGSPTPSIAVSDEALTGEYDVTVVTTFPQLADSVATSSGPMELWSPERVERYRREARMSDQVVLIGTERLPLLDPGGGIGLGMPPEDSTSAGTALATTPSLSGRRANGAIRWWVRLGLDRGWAFYVLGGDSTRLVGRWYWGGEVRSVEGYFCAVKRRAGAA